MAGEEDENGAAGESPAEGAALDAPAGEAVLPGGETTADRVLDQNEIDSLLGFDVGDGGSGERSGIDAILNSTLVSYERLPMLEIVFDRLVRLMTTIFAQLHIR